MLRSAKDLEGFAIGATDGTIEKVKDFIRHSTLAAPSCTPSRLR
jgi:hypothetical protein